MMRADARNSYSCPVRTEMTGTKQIAISYVFSKDESKLKEFLVEKTISQICSTEKYESKSIVVEKCYTKEKESECFHKSINKQKDENNEAEYEEYSVTDEVPELF